MENERLHPLRKWRLEQGFTLDAAAAGVGSVRSTWHDWETGRRIPDRDAMPRLYAFTRGVIDANSFHFPDGLPDLETPELPLSEGPAPLLDSLTGHDRAEAQRSAPEEQLQDIAA